MVVQNTDDLMHRNFSLRTVRRKENDLPWFDSVARKMSRKKNAIYKSEGTTERLYAQAEKLERRLQKRQEVYLQKQRDKMLGPAAASAFY